MIVYYTLEVMHGTRHEEYADEANADTKKPHTFVKRSEKT